MRLDVHLPRRGVELALTLALLAPFVGGQTPSLSKKKSKELRTLYAQNLGVEDAKLRSKFFARAERYARGSSAQAVATALSEGPIHPKKLKPRKNGEEWVEFGRVTTGLEFEAGGLTLRYAVDLPTNYSIKNSHPVLLHPGHGSLMNATAEKKAEALSFYRRMTDKAEFENWIIVRSEIVEQVGHEGKAGMLPEEEAMPLFEAFLRDLGSRFAVDLDHIYVSGYSQVGFWTWMLGRSMTHRLAGIVPLGAVSWEANAYLENFSRLPVYILHGREDEPCPLEPVLETHKKMVAAGYPVKLHVVEGAGHDYKAWGHLDEALRWLEPQARTRWPKEFDHKLQTRSAPRAYWIEALAYEKEGKGNAGGRPTASVSARVEGQEISLETQGLKSIRLWLSEELLDLNQECAVLHNGKEVFRGVLGEDLNLMLDDALRRGDWRTLPLARLDLEL